MAQWPPQPHSLHELNESLEWGLPSYPPNHHTHDEYVTASTRKSLTEPENWFRFPKANPLIDRNLFMDLNKLPFLPAGPQIPNEFELRKRYPAFWMLIAEITDVSLLKASVVLHQVKARDSTGCVFTIIFFPMLGGGLFNYETLGVGSTAVICCPFASVLMNGQIGLQMERLETIRMLQMSLEAVISCANLVHTCSVHRCWHCKSNAQRPLKRCCGCGYARYCGVKCQTADFTRHNAECANHNVRKIARLVYFAYGSAVRQQDKDKLRVAHPFDLFAQ